MHRRLRIGLTGGIGTGKSSVLKAFRRLGAETISLDEMAHRLSLPGGALYRVILNKFGKDFLSSDGKIDRRALGRKVFSRPALRRKLERATHPILLRHMRREIDHSKKPIVVADVPLLFEAGVETDFDVTMVVSARPAVAIRRVMRRDGTSRADVLRRARSQFPCDRKEAMADIVLRNEDSLGALNRSVGEYYRAFELIARVKEV